MKPSEYRAFLRTHRAILAPMAGVGDITFRRICELHGARYAFGEMVSAKGLAYNSKKTRELLRVAPGEDILGIQIFGHEPKEMAQEAQWIESYLRAHLGEININMGCPVRKVVSKGDGAALMKTPDIAQEIVACVAAAVDVPVTVKMRRGYYTDHESAPDLAKRVEAAGACAVTVHGRYATQMYRGKADWNSIARVKDAVSIPVIGNGDVIDGQSACAMTKQTGCDAVMIARGAEGNPWIFEQVNAALDGMPQPQLPSIDERIQCARDHARLLASDPILPLARMRKQASWYVRGLPGASVARGKFNQCTTLEDYNRVFNELEEYAHTFEREHR